jgi:transposase
MSDTHKLRDLKFRIRELEQLLGQKQFEIEDIKKKLGSKPLPGSGSTGKTTDGK